MAEAQSPYGPGSWKSRPAEDVFHDVYESDRNNLNDQYMANGLGMFPDDWQGMAHYLQSQGITSGNPADYFTSKGQTSWDPSHPLYDPNTGMVNSYDLAGQNQFGEFITVPAIFAAMIASAGAASGAIGAGAGAAEGAGAGGSIFAADASPGAFGWGAGEGLGGAGTLGGAGAADAAWGVNPATTGGSVGDTFLDNWDMLPDSFNTFQSPSVMNLGQFTSDPSILDSLKSLLGGNNMPPGTSTVLQKLLGGSGGLGGIGGLLGALAGGMGANPKPAGTTTTVQDIPDYLKPYQSMNLTSGVNNFNSAGQGSAILPGALDQMGRTIAGQYLDPNTNPAFQPYAKDLMGNALSVFNGQYGGGAGGNLNNSGFQEGAARAITNAALPLYNSAYQTERSNQVNAAQQAPGFASNYAGAALAPNLAFKNLYTGPQATSTPYFSNPAGGALAGGLAGLTLGNAFGK